MIDPMTPQEYNDWVEAKAVLLSIHGARLYREAMSSECPPERVNEIVEQFRTLNMQLRKLRVEHSLAVRLRGEDGETHE